MKWYSNSRSKRLSKGFKSRKLEFLEMGAFDIEENSNCRSPYLWKRKAGRIETETGDETNGIPPFSLPTSSIEEHEITATPALCLSTKPNSTTSAGNKSERSQDRGNSGKSVQTIRSGESDSGGTKNRGIGDERRRCLEFNFRDYEKGKKQELEGKFVVGSSENGEISSEIVDEEGQDVDKKADQFIKKFRAQIKASES